MKKSEENLSAKYALVIPFCCKDKHELKLNMSLWRKNGHIISEETTKFNIDLILYYATSNPDTIDDIQNEIMEYSSEFESYFNQIIFQSITLNKKDDFHPKAPGIMFFKLLLESQHYESIFYCESDCLPVKNNWLNGLYNEFERSKINDTWIKGSRYKGERKLFGDPARINHINGNAIFRVKPQQSKDLFNRISKAVLKRNGGYDVEMMVLMYNRKNKEDGKLFFDHCEYTDFIINFGKQKIPNKYLKHVPEKTYFMHGKQYFKHVFRDKN